MNIKNFLISLIIVAVFASSTFAWNYGTGSEADPYVIASASDFSYFRYRVNSGLEADGSYYRLSNDIQITQHVRTAPVGMSDAPFKGHFDGQGHAVYIKIMPLKEDDEALLSYDRAPFGTIQTASGYAVKNLHVGGSASGYLAAGIVSNLVSGTIQNCTFSGDIEAEPVLDDEETEIHLIHAGGIAANVRGGEIVSCDFSGNVTTKGNDFYSYAGGIAGAMSGGKIKGCTVKHYSVITAEGEADSGHSKSAGGIVGYIEVNALSTNSDEATVSYCEFQGGEIISDYTAGGIAGTSYGGILKNNTVAEDTKISSPLAGGVAGLLSAGGLLQNNNVLGGLVSADSIATGGVVGLLELGYVENNNSNAAVRGSASYQGGVVGQVHNHYGNSNNINSNTYSGSAYGIGINENFMKNQDTGSTKTAASSFYFITTSVLSNASEMVRYTSEIELSLPASVNLSAIPAWLNPVQNGVKIYLSGIPSSAGQVSFTLSANYGEQNVTKTYQITVIPQMSINVNDVSAKIGDFISITPSVSSLTDGYLNNATLSWSILSGDLPSSLEIDSATGTISGIVNQSGEFKFTIQVSAENVSASSVSKDITLTVQTSSDPGNPDNPDNPSQSSVKITSTSLPDGKLNESYSAVLTSSPSGASWSQSGGIIPPGLTLAADGVLSGVPTVTGNFSFYVTASLSQYSTATREFEIQISERSNIHSSSGGGGGGCNSLRLAMLVFLLLCYNVLIFSAKR